MKNKILSFLPFFIVLGVSLLTILPLFHSGFFPMHDNTQVQRVYEMHKALQDGMLPVRWVEDLGYGYGYPLFNFYAPLAYYIGAFFVFLLADSLIATKIMIGLAMVGSGVSMYFLAKSLWGKWGGVVSSTLYLLAPYHAVDLYVRGDIGELWAYVFFPVALLGVWRTYKKPSIISMSIGAVGLAGVILSHNLSAFLFMPFLLVALLVAVITSLRQGLQKSVFFQVGLLAFGLLLSVSYSLPVMNEISYTNVMSQVGGSADFHNHFVCLSQLWQSQWGFGGSTAGCVDGLSFMIGKIHLLLSLAALLILPFLWKRKESFILGLMGVGGLVISIFLMLSISTPVWNIVHQMAFLQYPWRYLLLASLFSSLLGGLVVSFFLQKQKLIGVGLGLLALFGVSFLNLKYFKPQAYIPVTNADVTSTSSLQWTTSKISDEYMPQSFVKPASADQIVSSLIVPNASLDKLQQQIRTQEKTMIFNLIKPQTLSLNLAFFPGWSAFDNGKPIQLFPSSKGVSVNLSAGPHKLTLRYSGTFIEELSNAISLSSAIILILAIIWEVAKIYERKSA